MASDQQFCLRWNNHQSTLVSVFDNLLESQTLVDCTLAADGQYLKAHKVVLSACSPYLEAILCQNLDKHPILILKDVKFTELKAMLDYMYRGEVNISQEQLSTFLKAAESLQIKGLTDSGGGGGGDLRDKRSDLRKPLTQPVPHIPQPRPVVPHGLLDQRRSLPHFPLHIADMQPQSPQVAREGSTSPTARKRRRPNRPSSDDSNFVSTPNSLSENQPDTSDSCDLPVKQNNSITSNVPNSTKAPETDSPRSTPQPMPQQNLPEQKQVSVKKEFNEAAMLTPKTELDYGNDNSMEDVNYEDDDDEEVDLSKPGPSFSANSQGFPPWQVGGDGSNDDSNNIYSPDVTAANNQNNSQGFKRPVGITTPLRAAKLKGIGQRQNVEKQSRRTRRVDGNVNGASEAIVQEPQSSPDNPIFSSDGKKLGAYFLKKRTTCPKCNAMVCIKSLRIHSKYYCGVQPDEREWKLCGRQCLCKKCGSMQEPDAIEFHVGYLCKMKPIKVQCFYCPRLFSDYRGFLTHTANAHGKKHKYLDLISILPKADPVLSQRPQKVVKNHFNISSTVVEEAFVEATPDSKLHLRQKTVLKCDKCGKELIGIHAFENHVNTRCESEDQNYTCFFCEFQAAFAYQVLDHMEELHDQYFNTFDLLQAKNTGIIPTLRNGEGEVDFADRNLYEPYISPSLILPPKKRIKMEPDHVEKKVAIQLPSAVKSNHENNYPSCSKADDDEVFVQFGEGKFNPNESFNNVEDTEVVVQIGENVKIRNNRRTKIPLQSAVASREVKPLKNRPTLKVGLPHKRFKTHGHLFVKHKKEPVKYFTCETCSKSFHQDSIRTHKKYHCGKEDVEYSWVLKSSGKAFCKKCKTLQSARHIDFHVDYNCNQKNYSVQCFYCPKITTTYRSLLVHMRMGHNKIHFFEDLMTILPPKEKLSQKEDGSKEQFSSNLVFHPFIYEPPIKNAQDDPTMFRFPSGTDLYACLYCSFQRKAVFEILDHMEEVHEKKHKLYDVLQAKLVKETENKA